MKIGKISESVLKRSVLKQLHREEDTRLLNRPQVGADHSIVELGTDELLVTAVETVALEQEKAVRAAVIRAANNVAVSGAEVIGIENCILMPGTTNEAQLKKIVAQMERTCQELGMEILGGHTEVTRAVNYPVVTVTAFGALKKEVAKAQKKGGPDMDVIVTKWVGMEATAMLAEEKQEELQQRYPLAMIEEAKKMEICMPILSEAATAVKSGVGSMHDVSQGGIFAALWEIAQQTGVGLQIDLKKIPIRQETVEICEYYGLNPYKILSGGSMLLLAEHGNEVVWNLEKAGIHATVIGRTTDGNDRVILNEEETRYLELPGTDEIYQVLG